MDSMEQDYQNERDDARVKKKILHILDEYILRRFTVLTGIIVICSIVSPILLFYYLMDQTDFVTTTYKHSCLVNYSYRIPCGESGITLLHCDTIACCYDVNSKQCYQAIPSKYFYYGGNKTSSQQSTPYKNPTFPHLNLAVEKINQNKLIIKLSRDDSQDTTSEEASNATYNYTRYKESLGIEVYRTETNELLLSTYKGPLVASDGYWEWSMFLSNESLHGLGEIVLGGVDRKITKTIYKNKNDHNTVPIFMAPVNGKYHGLLIRHDGPLEVSVLPSRMIIIRSLVGDNISLELCTGPTPKDVRSQFRSSQNDSIIPYWILGAHICRDGNTTARAAIDEFKTFVSNESPIKYSSDCIHESIYALLNEIHITELENLILDLQKANSHFVMSISPQLLKKNSDLYNYAVDSGMVYRDQNNETFVGKYLGEDAVYVDYNHTSISEWMTKLKDTLPKVKFDGFVLRDNWPQVDSYSFVNTHGRFPYLTQDIRSALSETLPWDALASQSEDIHILRHNQYAFSQAKGFRSYFGVDYLISASFDHGMSEGAHIQNVDISWSNFKKAIIATLYHGIFESSLFSVPICGTTKNYDIVKDEDLCIRWYIAAATFPLYRISSENPRRDPSNLYSQFGTRITKLALKNRHKLLLYYYSILNSGEPLARPMFYDFYYDKETYNLEKQYMLGNSLLVAQPFEPGIKDLAIYFPPSVKVWYEFWGGQKISASGWTNFSILATDWIMFIAEGSIIPLRHILNEKVTGDYDSNDSIELAIALGTFNDTSKAEGKMLFESTQLIFEADTDSFTIRNVKKVKQQICEVNTQRWPSKIKSALIYGKGSLIEYSNFQEIDICTVNDDVLVTKFSTKIIKN